MKPWELEDRWERHIKRSVNVTDEVIFLEDSEVADESNS